MKIKKISHMVPRDLVNDCLDVCVTLDDDSSYLIEITTPEFITVLMGKKGKFLPPGYPYIIVSELTDEVIRSAIQEFIDAKEDSYWLKLYFMVITLDSKDVNEILERKEKEDRELDARVEAEMKADSKINLNTSSAD